MKFVIKLMLPLSLFCSAQAQMSIRFQPHVTPHAQLLGDLVLISNDQNNWMSLPLDSQAPAGKYLSKDQIINWLIQKNGVFEYQWQGKKIVLIEQANRSAGKELVLKAQQALEKQLGKKYRAVELTSTSQLKDSGISLVDFNVELPSTERPAKQMCVRLVHEKRSIPVWFRVKIWQKVLVATKKINSRTLIQSSDFVLKKRDIAGLNDIPVAQLSQKLWLNQSLNKNQILTEHKLRKMPQIIKGETVAVRVSSRGISISAKAIAQNDAYVGQIIQMKNPDTDKYFAARVTAPNQAEVVS